MTYFLLKAPLSANQSTTHLMTLLDLTHPPSLK